MAEPVRTGVGLPPAAMVLGDPEPELLRLKAAAKYLGLHANTLAGYAQDGVVPGFKLGGQWKFSKKDLDRWIARQAKTGKGKR